MASTILIIEDDSDVRAALQALLKKVGYEVVSASDGASALKVAQQRWPHLILTDLGLPGGDGFLVIERIRRVARLRAVPIVVLTGRSSEENRARAERAGVVAFLSKPPNSEELLKVIAEAMGRAAPGTGQGGGASGASSA
jgi:chemosensory pili system protein ChpA (sensor histidine kinase/response regulator)